MKLILPGQARCSFTGWCSTCGHAYAFLVLLWEKILRAPLPEWRYMLLNFIGGGAFAYTVVFIAFEQIARYGVEQHGVNEFWFMATSYIGFIAVIVWRGRARTIR